MQNFTWYAVASKTEIQTNNKTYEYSSLLGCVVVPQGE